jgi:hypothetical protein
MSATDPRVVMLAELREPAFRLGMAFAAEAERAADVATKVEFSQLFHRCFFSVRVAIGLELRLERRLAVRPEPRDTASDWEDLCDREPLDDRDPPDRPDRPDRYDPEYDRERDRETERASFPILVRTLDGVVAEAGKLTGPEPAELPTLRDLLAKVKSGPPPASQPALKARLTGSGAAPAVAAARRPASNVGEILAARRATGPPHR